MPAKHVLRNTALAAALCTAAVAALAQTPAPAPAPAEPPKVEPDWTFATNVGIFSQYVFRGIQQTNDKPALQGGFDLSHKSGFYVGTWLSNVSWISDNAPEVSASLEWDMYGGYKWDLGNDLVWDFGGLYYYYPGSYPNGFTKPDTFELYTALNWKFLQVKYSNSVGNKTFGFPDSRGSDYIEGNINYDIVDKVNDWLGKITLIGHVGRQTFKHYGDFDYTDWKVGAAGDFSGVTLGVYVTGTDAKNLLYTNRFGRDTSDTQVVGYIQKSF